MTATLTRIFSKIVPYNLRTRFNSSRVVQYTSFDHRSSTKQLVEYLKHGQIAHAQKVFDEMPQRDIVAWSIMIHGFARNGLNSRAFDLFSRFRNLGFVPNAFTLVGLLVAVAGLQGLALAHCVHGIVVKYGLVFDSVVATAMLDAYAKCRSVLYSRKLFDEMECPSLVTVNALLAGMVQNGLLEEAVKLFVEFRRDGLIPDSRTMPTLIQGCGSQGYNSLCECMHALVVKVGLVSETAFNNSLLGMYSSLMDLDAAKKVFNGIECKDVISWTTMMGLLNELEYSADAISLFREMRKNNSVMVDYVNMVNLIGSCAHLGDLSKAKQIHTQAIICGHVSHTNVVNSFITLYAKCGELRLSRIVFDKSIQKTSVSWSAIISAYVQNEHPHGAIDLLIKFRRETKHCLDSVSLVSALRACGDLALLVYITQLHCHAFVAGFPHYTSVQNSMISAYSKCGNVELASQVFRGMGDLQNVVSWNAILNGLGINGQGRNAVTLFYEMMKGTLSPDSATYLSVLSACSHSGLVYEGLKIFEKMIGENIIDPSEEIVGCIVDLLARAGCLYNVSGFISRFLSLMGHNGWKALLSGCLLHGNVEMAEFMARRLVELYPEDAEIVVVLSNIFASFGRFDDAEGLRSNIENNRLIKNPGISLLGDTS